jgi:hypothetical protein
MNWIGVSEDINFIHHSIRVGIRCCMFRVCSESITLFLSKEEIVVQPYENYITKLKEAIKRLHDIIQTVDSVNGKHSVLYV